MKADGRARSRSESYPYQKLLPVWICGLRLDASANCIWAHSNTVHVAI
jgi:hypothetical protein